MTRIRLKRERETLDAAGFAWSNPMYEARDQITSIKFAQNLTNDLKSTYLLDGKQYLGAIVEAWSSQ